MAPRLGVSGSTILSDGALLQELFWDGIDHIEIGEFASEDDFARFLELREKHAVTFGVHAPLFRTQSKNDLLQKIQYEPSVAWEQLEQSAEKLSALGAEYILVHYPYLNEIPWNADDLIREGLIRLSEIQQKYSISIICEPKLGFNKSSSGIEQFDQTPTQWWQNIGGLCMDVGDLLIAKGDALLHTLTRWKPQIKVVHLHHVHHHPDGKYWWIPMHPSHETDGIHTPLGDVVKFLSDCTDVTFIFEHTPHSEPTSQFVREGFEWIKELTGQSAK